MSLSKFQTAFKDLMLSPQSALSKDVTPLEKFVVNDEIQITQRLKVYHNNIVGNLTEVLRGCYPLCENLVGKDFFKSMCRAFIFKKPPRSGCMIFYGAGFSEFIKTHKPAMELPYLNDVAALEWALHRAYYAENDLPLTAETLSQTPPDLLESLNLSPRKSATLISSNYPLTKIRDFCISNTQNNTLNIASQSPHHFLIHRGADFEVLITPINECEFAIISLIRQKHSLGSALASTIEHHPNFDFTLFLQKHLTLETFTEIDANEV